MVLFEKEKVMRVTGGGVCRDLQSDLQCLVPFLDSKANIVKC